MNKDNPFFDNDELQPTAEILAAIDTEQSLELPMLDNFIPAGFPSPTQGIQSDGIDLNRELIRHPSSTFCARVTGNSMIDSGISDGDIIIVDKSLDPHDGAIAVCYLDGEFTLKRIAIRETGVWLVPANPKFPEIWVNDEANFQVWGIVTYIIKQASAGSNK